MTILPGAGHAPLTHGKQNWLPCCIQGVPHSLIALPHSHLQQQRCHRGMRHNICNKTRLQSGLCCGNTV